MHAWTNLRRHRCFAVPFPRLSSWYTDGSGVKIPEPPRHTMQSYMHARYRGPALDGIPRLTPSKLGTISPSPGSHSPVRPRPPSFLKESSSVDRFMIHEDDHTPADVRYGVWSAFNVKSETWGNSSLLKVAREHHAAVDRLKAAARPPSPRRSRRPASGMSLHGHRTRSLTEHQWPRGTLPTDTPLERVNSLDVLSPLPRAPLGGGNWTSSRPVSPAGSKIDYAASPAVRLYARELRPATYGWSGAGGFGPRKGMIFR